ncbi:DNA polymerase III subunit delta [Henriciella aquimarina]|uniref:DNA polymerase III subunit delta n=1 Tax=Henriciella aquimarina TaxID=545261 RepID=UPI000A00D43C|nr:DNA polymerase III subunit delta [Henriciella aquimarina]
MILKGGAISGQVRKPSPDIWCILVFGDDDGVVADTATQFIGGWTKAEGGNANTLSLDDDDVRREPGLLINRIETASLLGETDIIRIRTSGEKLAKIILDLVGEADAQGTPFANRLIIQAGTLAKRSKLRTGIEAAKTAATVHVFSDTEQSIRDLVVEKLKAEQIEIEDEALDRFTSALPGHRGLANQETDKLVLFGYDLGRPISLADIRQLSQTDADNSIRDMIHAALDGQAVKCLEEYDRVAEAGTSAISILRALESEVRRLLQARGLAGTGGNVGMKLKPPVWQSEWPAFRARMDRWSMPALTRLMAAIHDHELQAKQSGPAADASIRLLLLNILRSAAKRSRPVASP